MDVQVVTNAARGWLEATACMLLPRWLESLRALGTRVVYARPATVTRPEQVGSACARGGEISARLSSAQRARERATREGHSRSLSVADSPETLGKAVGNWRWEIALGGLAFRGQGARPTDTDTLDLCACVSVMPRRSRPGSAAASGRRWRPSAGRSSRGRPRRRRRRGREGGAVPSTSSRSATACTSVKPCTLSAVAVRVISARALGRRA
eukprot:COSAG01_NODE_3969_length_5482_cov_13.681962_5_plen_210_part_00